VPADETNVNAASEEVASSTEAPVLTCRRCGTVVPPERVGCPLCGDPQYRVCTCGERLRLDLRECPQCGADWSRAVKVRHRSRRAKLDTDVFWRYTLSGAALALLLAAGVKALVDFLAQRALPPGMVMPASFVVRAQWAGQGLTAVLRNLSGSLRDVASALGPLLIVVLLGAAIGAGLYLYRKDFFSRPRGTPRRRRRRHDAP
jgi:hypothetical protein